MNTSVSNLKPGDESTTLIRTDLGYIILSVTFGGVRMEYTFEADDGSEHIEDIKLTHQDLIDIIQGAYSA